MTMKELLKINLEGFLETIVYEQEDISRDILLAYVAKRGANNIFILRALRTEINRHLDKYYNIVGIKQWPDDPLVQKTRALIKEIEDDPESLYRTPFETPAWKSAFDKAVVQEDFEEPAMETCIDQYYVFMLLGIIEDEIARLERIEKPKRGRPRKAVLQTYKAVCSDEVLRQVYRNLIPKYIHARTKEEDFLKVFNETPVEEMKPKIDWLSSKTVLYSLLFRLTQPPFKPKMADYCFLHNGESLHLKHNDKPKSGGHYEIDFLLERSKA